KDGFIFLVMGFTGKKAVQFKEAYIAEFNRMEAQLLAPQQTEPKRRGPYKNRKSDLPCGVYHHQSKYNPYRATAHVDGKFVHVGSFPTVDDAVAAIEHFYETGTVQRLHKIKTKPHINISNLIPKNTNNSLNQTDLINHLKVFLEAAQLLSGYQYGKDLAWDLIAFTQEEASRHC
ncbi:Rha family transcriptional regulator, partial [Proteus mirabilis]